MAGPSSDLSSLFPPAAAGAQLGQGTIQTWDPLTGSNTVAWAGGLLTDVPILNTAEAITFKPGHVVVLLGGGNSWFIIGRVTAPGDPNFASASVGFSAKNGQATGFSLSTSLVTKSSCTLDVPEWADEVAIMVLGSCTVVNSKTVEAADFASCAVFVDGVTGPGIQQGYSAGPTGGSTNQNVQAMSVSTARVYTVVGGSTILCEMQIRSANAAWLAHASNIAEISAMAIFRSTV